MTGPRDESLYALLVNPPKRNARMITPETAGRVRQLFALGLRYQDIATRVGISKASIAIIVKAGQ